MRKAIEAIALGLFVMLATSFSCAQNGPTQPLVTLTWTQSPAPGVTKNCIYRGAVAGTYTLPGTCIPANTTYTDTTPVAGTTYYYAVTAQVGATESAYSTPLEVVVPANPAAPSGLTAPTVTENKTTRNGPKDVVARVEWRSR
jgi:fibronectin type 3 domain-containing protein